MSFTCTRRALLVLAGCPAAAGAAYPARPVTLVVPFAPAGIADLTARAVAEPMARGWGQPVVVDNRPGAGSIVASQAVLQARPDGHTLLLLTNAHAVSTSLFRRLPYDPVKDFAPIGLIGRFDLGVFAPAVGGHATLREAIAWAAARPGRLRIGTLVPGSTQHLAARWFETLARIEALVVPYKASGALLTALRSGEVDLAFEVLGPMLPQLGAGGIRVLAVSSGQRHPALPEVPTVQQSGVPGYDVASWNALAAPAATAPEVLGTIGRALRSALAQPPVRDRLAALGVRPEPGGADELRALLASEIERWGAVVRAARIEPE